MQLIVKFNESVDGGYLAPFGTYKSNLDYDCDIVRNLIINRKLSPFSLLYKILMKVGLMMNYVYY